MEMRFSPPSAELSKLAHIPKSTSAMLEYFLLCALEVLN